MNDNTGRPEILLVDDEEAWLRSLRLNLMRAGITNTLTCTDPQTACGLVATRNIAAAIIDLMMPQMNGEELLRRLHETAPDLPIIILTGVKDVNTAVRCVKAGAFDFFVKTSEIEGLLLSLRRALEFTALRSQTDRLRTSILQETLCHPDCFEDILTQDRAMRALFRYCEATAPSVEPILITGETGTGKEMIARAVHCASRREGPMVSLNVAGLDDSVFADTLFGHRKGAYTGADVAREGLVRQASGGTLFLDEIGDLSLSSQVKLLRLLQEREFYPLGADTPQYSDARIVVATHRSVAELQHSGTFRQDLLYRLRTYNAHLPALRERPGDIPLLLAHFVSEAAGAMNKPRPDIAPEVHALLARHRFPGNVRELRAMAFDAVTSCHGQVLYAADFQRHALTGLAPEPGEPTMPTLRRILFGEELPTLKECANLLVEEAMQRAQGNQGTAAAMLGITRQALNNRLRQRANGDGADD